MHILSSYIDAIYLQGDSELESIQNVADTIILLQELGFYSSSRQMSVDSIY